MIEVFNLTLLGNRYGGGRCPAHVALFVSGDGGWDLGVVEMARELASLDTLVAGIDIVRYLQHLGSQLEVCGHQTTENFVKQVNTGRLVLLPKVGHGFSVPRNWLPELRSELRQLTAPPIRPQLPARAAIQDLPLVEVPADTPGKNVIAVILTGDGGWAGIDREIAGVLAQNGIPVIGLNSLKYFWKKKTPETAAADLDRILKAYMAVWKKDRAVLIGYSLGADVLPFMANRLAPELLDRVELITLLGPDSEVDWEFHLTDWLGGRSRNSVNVLPEVEKLAAKHVLCVYGQEETGSLCPQLSGVRVRVVASKGAHHFGGSYEAIANTILSELRR